MEIRFVTCSEAVVTRNGGVGFLAETEYVTIEEGDVCWAWRGRYGARLCIDWINLAEVGFSVVCNGVWGRSGTICTNASLKT